MNNFKQNELIRSTCTLFIYGRFCFHIFGMFRSQQTTGSASAELVCRAPSKENGKFY